MTNYSNIRYASSGTTVYADMNALIAATGSDGDQALVQSTNNIYVYSGTGWYKIATVQNDSPSAITGVDGSYALATDGTATTITAVSTDPEGFPLTWTYSTSGLGSIATVSQADNVFTVTPSTDSANVGTFTLTINATDGINGAVSATTSIELEFIITNSNYTTLLATAVDTSTNNNITDSSSNNHSLTGTNPYAGTFSPYRHGGYSTSFDGTGNTWFNFPTSTDFNLTDQSFHISFWCYPKALGDYDTIIAQMGTMAIELLSNSMRMWLSTGTGGSWDLLNAAQISNTLNLNEWAYITVVRDTDNNTLKSYHNGTLVYNNTNFTGTVGNSTNSMDIGKYNNSSVNSWNGYIRDLRYRVGTNSENTSNSVPTEAVTSEDSLTKLLTCHSPFISDGSSNSRSVTIVGNPATEPFTPYDYAAEYSASSHGGSVFFDGDVDHLEGPSVDIIGNGAFTVECWVYILSNTTGYTDAFLAQYQTNGKFIIGVKSDVVRVWMGGSEVRVGTTNINNNGWHHIALVRDSSNSCQLYVDGVAEGAAFTNSTDFSTSLENFEIGSWDAGNNSDLHGYISDLRVVKGTAVYTSTFTPAAAPLSTISGTTLHVKGTDASIIDKSQVNNIKMNGPTTGSTTKTFVGSEPTISFMSGSNTDRYLEFDPTVLNFMEILGDPSIPFTIEGIWGWQGSTASPIFEIFQDTDNFFYFGAGRGGTTNGVTTSENCYGIFKIGGTEKFKLDGGTGGYHVTGSSFKHQAITRNSSGVIKHWYNGSGSSSTATHSGSNTVSWSSPTGYIGASQIMGSLYGRYEGYIHQIRLTVGLARYTANFTPPTASLKG